MENIILNNKVYKRVNFKLEDSLEDLVVKYSKEIFGKDTLYFDIKKRMSKDRIISIPDAYLIDFTFENDPKFCIIENELTQHDVFKHIGEQILKFDVSYKASGHKLKEVILSEIQKDSKKENFIKEKIDRSQYNNRSCA